VSAETLRGIEDALRAHFESGLDGDSSESRRGAVIIDWLAVYTISNVVDIDGRLVVGFTNDLVSPDTNPNSQAHMALWAHRYLSSVLDHSIEDD
jgi:hypothetical protein